MLHSFPLIGGMGRPVVVIVIVHCYEFQPDQVVHFYFTPSVCGRVTLCVRSSPFHWRISIKNEQQIDTINPKAEKASVADQAADANSARRAKLVLVTLFKPV